MNERTTLEIIAPTVEEAIAQGLEQLGLTADAVSVEVLDAGNKGLFGLGKPHVRVRLTVNPPAGMAPVVSEVKEVRTEPAASKKEAKRGSVCQKGRPQTLEPMPSDERRIIHIALRDHPQVTTESTGDDPYRKVTIIPKNA